MAMKKSTRLDAAVTISLTSRSMHVARSDVTDGESGINWWTSSSRYKIKSRVIIMNDAFQVSKIQVETADT